MVKVLICGGGNGAHVMSTILSSKKNLQVNVLTVYQDEPEKWSNLMSTGEVTVKLHQSGNKAPYYIKSKPDLITRDPAIASSDCDVIILAVPSYAHNVFLKLLKPYIREGILLIGCPGHAGFEYEVQQVLGDKLAEITLMSTESLPWACRIIEYGKSAEVLATKASLMCAIKYTANQQVSMVKDPGECFQYLLGPTPKLEIQSTFLGLTLKSLNASIHPSIMYGYWRKWNGKCLNKKPLFYNGLDEETADILANVSTECVTIAKVIMQLRPDVDLNSVEHVSDWFLRTYADDIEDKSTMYSTIRTNRAYQGLCHPCISTPDGKFLPDFTHRYLREDIPYGLVVVKGVAEIVGVKTPVMDEVITWAQENLGKQFLVAGRLCSIDAEDTRTPQVYGMTSMEDLLRNFC